MNISKNKDHLKSRIESDFRNNNDIPYFIRVKILNSDNLLWDIEVNNTKQMIESYEKSCRKWLTYTEKEIYKIQKDELLKVTDEYISNIQLEQSSILGNQDMIGIIESIMVDCSFGFLYDSMKNYKNELTNQINDLYENTDILKSNKIVTAAEYRSLKVNYYIVKINELQKKLEDDQKLFETTLTEYKNLLKFIDERSYFKISFIRINEVNDEFDINRFSYISYHTNAIPDSFYSYIVHCIDNLIVYNYSEKVKFNDHDNIKNYIISNSTDYYTFKVSDDISIKISL
jgi:hypothetical protein